MNRLLLLLLIAMPCLAGAELRVHPHLETTVTFADGTRTVSVLVSNLADTPLQQVLRVRLYQTANRLAVPVGAAQEVSGVALAPGQAVLHTVTTTLPEVKTPTQFRLRFADADGKLVGDVPVTVIPEGMLRGALGSRPVRLYDPNNNLAPFLKKIGADCHPYAEEHPQKSAEQDLTIAWLATGQAEANRRLFRELAPQIEAGARVLCVVEPGSLEDQPVEFPQALHKGRGTLVCVPAASLRHLAESAAAQWRLSQYLELTGSTLSILSP